MTTIQIITLETQAKTNRVMIEEMSKDNFRIYLSEKNTDGIFTPFVFLADTKFNTPQDALNKVISFLNNQIIKVDNQISSLLTTDEIKKLTNCNNISES